MPASTAGMSKIHVLLSPLTRPGERSIGGKDHPGIHDYPPLIDMEAVKALIASGDKALINATDNGGRTALFYCAQYSQPNQGGMDEEADQKREICKLLLAAGADITIKDNHGTNVLHLACMSEDYNGGIVDQICAAGGKVEEPDTMFANTALHWAAATGLPPIVEPLLALPGAAEALKMKNKGGQIPLDIAKDKAGAGAWQAYPYKSSVDVVKMLEAAAKKK